MSLDLKFNYFGAPKESKNSQNARTVIQIKTKRSHLIRKIQKKSTEKGWKRIFMEANLKEKKNAAQRRAHENKENNVGSVWMIKAININWGLVLNSSSCMTFEHRDAAFFLFMLKWSVAFCVFVNRNGTVCIKKRVVAVGCG